MKEFLTNDYFLTVIMIVVSFSFGWIVGKYHTEMEMRREQLRREQELQKMASFGEYIISLQGGEDEK